MDKRAITCIIFSIFLTACGGGGGGQNNVVSNKTFLTSGVTATLDWQAPQFNEDSSELTDLAGYKLYYGTEPGNYTEAVNIGSATTASITGLKEGTTYYFALVAYDLSGNESQFSAEIKKTI